MTKAFPNSFQHHVFLKSRERRRRGSVLGMQNIWKMLLYFLTDKPMNTTPSHDSDNIAFHTYLSNVANGTDISASVAQEALDYDDPKAFFEHLSKHGCV